MDREITLIGDLLGHLVHLREQNEISSASYNICLYLLRELNCELNSRSRVSRRPHPDEKARLQLNIELARAGNLFQLSRKE